MKRFYTEVRVKDRAILLDDRPVRTPGRAPLVLVTDALAEAVADEWRGQGEEIDPRSMPLTGIANAAIDRVAPVLASFAAGLAAYGESELLCYRAERPDALIARQEAAWDPILAWARQRFDVGFRLVAGIMHKPQPPETLARLAEAVAALSPFQLAGLHPAVTISGSLVIPLAVIEDVLEPDAAFDAAHLDELWQEEQWGADAFALNARNLRRADFLSACRFLTLLR